MLRQLRNSSFISFFYGFMALYMLNICVDSPDALPNTVPEDLSYNDQESIIEIVLEKLLGCEDAIPELDDNDSNPHTTFKNHTAIDHFILPSFESIPKGNANAERSQGNSMYFLYTPSHYLEVYSPPPEA
ncbi:hypothetical protein FNH22_05940 [Fulvivirga sp. M361]|uniref:hypothetical protein n=1 Tax=Fulvivirga sp. M361 TaxID=2594266 RepID=UPI00117BBBEC|nr:hypothetical protein [Fulvivirga sp. M361]TRX60590.1 hypothetical protein FNH22_05940 [Fulvivirga sp. M361]